jgi:hypothetical protein
MCKLLAQPHPRLFLLRPFTLLIRQTWQAVHAIKQSISLDVYGWLFDLVYCHHRVDGSYFLFDINFTARFIRYTAYTSTGCKVLSTLLPCLWLTWNWRCSRGKLMKIIQIWLIIKSTFIIFHNNWNENQHNWMANIGFYGSLNENL